MTLMWVKLLSGIIFILVPGFLLSENLKKYPLLTLFSIFLGLLLLFLSLSPVLKENNDIGEIKQSLMEIKRSISSANFENIEPLYPNEIDSKKTENRNEIIYRDNRDLLIGENEYKQKFENNKQSYNYSINRHETYFQVGASISIASFIIFLVIYAFSYISKILSLGEALQYMLAVFFAFPLILVGKLVGLYLGFSMAPYLILTISIIGVVVFVIWLLKIK